MRAFILFSVVWALLAHPASAAGTLPSFRIDTPYPKVRAEMIRLGYEPVRFLKRSENSPMGCRRRDPDKPDLCRLWPERMHCSEGIGRCDFLFERVRDGAQVIVNTEGNNWVYWCYCFVEIRWLTQQDSERLRDYVIARPAPSGRDGARWRWPGQPRP